LIRALLAERKKLKANILTLETLNPTFGIFFSVSGYEYYYSIERRIATTSMVSIVLLLYLGIRNVIFNYGNSSSKENNRECKTNSLNLL
jgi:hypothetical protein